MPDPRHSPGDQISLDGASVTVISSDDRSYRVTRDVSDPDATIFAVARATLDARDPLIVANRGQAYA